MTCLERSVKSNLLPTLGQSVGVECIWTRFRKTLSMQTQPKAMRDFSSANRLRMQHFNEFLAFLIRAIAVAHAAPVSAADISYEGLVGCSVQVIDRLHRCQP